MLVWLAIAAACFLLAAPTLAQEPTSPNTPSELGLPKALDGFGGPEQWSSPSGLNSALQIMLAMTVISLAPAILLMTTSFVRIIVVLGLLRWPIREPNRHLPA